jgi:hypothetical protein
MVQAQQQKVKSLNVIDTTIVLVSDNLVII